MFRIYKVNNVNMNKRFGTSSTIQINDCIKKKREPQNTVKSKKFVWKQFMLFCAEKNYVLDGSTTNQEISDILKDWAYNMRKVNGQEYKENVVKMIWNLTAKLVQVKYMEEYQREIDPFADIIFKSARDARNAKRKILQAIPDKRTKSADVLQNNEYAAMINAWNEDTPQGLQIKFFLIASLELAWRSGEAVSCLVHYFQEELANDGTPTGRIQYNRGGSLSKWLMKNTENPQICPVRLFRKLMSRRNENRNIKTDRLFLSVNPFWNNPNSSGWYKNMPMGRNEISKWTRNSAKRAGVDVNNKKITNHSNRATAVSNFAKTGNFEPSLTRRFERRILPKPTTVPVCFFGEDSTYSQFRILENGNLQPIKSEITSEMAPQKSEDEIHSEDAPDLILPEDIQTDSLDPETPVKMSQSEHSETPNKIQRLDSDNEPLSEDIKELKIKFLIAEEHRRKQLYSNEIAQKDELFQLELRHKKEIHEKELEIKKLELILLKQRLQQNHL